MTVTPLFSHRGGAAPAPQFEGYDPAHPYDEHRHVLAEASLHPGDKVWRHDASDGWQDMPIRAVVIDTYGPAVEVGPYSITPSQARRVAAFLNAAADVADPTTERNHR